jgi:hypothetical protein
MPQCFITRDALGGVKSSHFFKELTEIWVFLEFLWQKFTCVCGFDFRKIKKTRYTGPNTFIGGSKLPKYNSQLVDVIGSAQELFQQYLNKKIMIQFC